MDWKTFPYISFNFVNPNTRTHFSLQFRSSTPCILFVSDLEGLATQSKAQMKLRFFETETAIKIKLSGTLEQLNQ